MLSASRSRVAGARLLLAQSDTEQKVRDDARTSSDASACHELMETPASREYQQRWPLRIFADR